MYLSACFHPSFHTLNLEDYSNTHSWLDIMKITMYIEKVFDTINLACSRDFLTRWQKSATLQQTSYHTI